MIHSSTGSLYRGYMRTGVNLHKLPSHALTHVKNIKHKSFYTDLIIERNTPFERLQVISEDSVDFLKRWGFEIPFDYEILYYESLRNYINPNTDKATQNIINPKQKGLLIEVDKTHEYTYECNNNKILKNITNLIKGIQAFNTLAKADTAKGIYPTQSLLMHHVLQERTNESVQQLRKYKSNKIISVLMSPLFKHHYKIIHPDTKVIKTKI